jgi:phosphoribosylformimino-5-aminoimidazole carboxamide ribotide isomerase
MHVLPVLDLKNGLVVRGVAGRRADYQPVVSRLSASARPLDVARAFHDHFGLGQLYLADLDAISGARPALGIYEALRAAGFRLWVDAGIRGAPDAWPLRQVGVERIVAGLETLRGPTALTALCAEFGEGLVFSLDLKKGQPLGDPTLWDAADAWGIAERAVACGVQQVLVLDLACVGRSAGIGTEHLCGRLVRTYPGLTVLAGGGVRGLDELHRLQRLGVAGVLIASALHDGRLNREELRPFMQEVSEPPG